MTLLDLNADFLNELKKIRRDLHAHPELCFEEFRTSDVIAKNLEQWGITVVRGLGKTGVVGIIQRGKSTKMIGLRADMDALPMQEDNTFAHASKTPNKMHGCGHDGHTAMLLGAAYYLSQHSTFDGTVVLIFQPAEEGGGGAKRMMDDGLFERFPVQAIFGMHNYPGLPVGEFSVAAGPMLASSSEFKLEVLGKGSHAAQPQLSVDSLLIGIQIVQGWQSIISRSRNPMDGGVLSVTQFHSGTASNVIAGHATIAGTVRTFSKEMLDLVEQRMHDIATHTAAAYGATVHFEFVRSYSVLINEPVQTALAIEVMQSIAGQDKVDSQFRPILAAEDFAFMLEQKPGCYVHIGNGGDNHREHGHGLGPCQLHNASYDFNDASLPIGTTYWVRLVERFLSDQ